MEPRFASPPRGQTRLAGSASLTPNFAATAALGDFEISLIRDSCYWWDGGAYFGVVPKTLWSRKLPADEFNRVPLAFNCYLIRTSDHTILVETGGGDNMDARPRAHEAPAMPRAAPYRS